VGFHVVIPARFASTRLPGKPLLEIGGIPMIQRVVERACSSAADRVLVATDDERIAAAVSDPRNPGERIALMTDATLQSGTDRVAEVAKRLGWDEATVVVNVQGDEPFIAPRLIDQVAKLLQENAAAGIATLSTPVTDIEELLNPNVVKVVTRNDGLAMYFSRAPIPWNRAGPVGRLMEPRDFAGAMRHVGIYAYRVGVLRQLTRMPPSELEQREQLEQLRAMQNAVAIAVARCVEVPGPGVDTAEDLERARQRIAGDS
jgi:3-deoxy-manno-octulosonate cytidylyltransferase (CMP-KDO synthetase)